MTDEFDMIEIENDWIVRCNKIGMSRNDVVELLNIYEKENEQLKKGIVDCVFGDEDLQLFAERMGLIE